MPLLSEAAHSILSNFQRECCNNHYRVICVA